MSSTAAVEIRGLHKTYRRRGRLRTAVDRLDLAVPQGGVHGFLGPNGAGKTTTIRMLLGLVRADSGRMRIFDAEVPRELPRVIDRVGAIVEQPRFFPTFTGRKNLQLLASAIGVPRARVDAVLDEVGLGDRGRDRFRGYSLGMKQRLAVAGTLLKDPDLLIFDEPTNGLDPAGIHEIRETMRGLADRGKTVLVSSHILAEVQQVADTVSIIGNGALLAEGTVASLLAGAGATGPTARVWVQQGERAAGLLRDAGFVVRPQPDRALLVSRPDRPLDPSEITRTLAGHGLYLSELSPQRADLESVFLGLTAHTGPSAQHHAGRGTGGTGHPPPPGDQPRHGVDPHAGGPR
ncbi:ABC-2 type transport system ATP-binding protein [Friedmanniella endophytica]|uniref:ABC-2 type transport system ATP-binding protein n=1 Tax=Microlunatus kandeliicorticis TaxID=1759536 RepID=A0A7W3ISG8_9ACTN|nr:ATP-binding cassette domain-containing protein [Microlunatus kandeliicorticis]MBA8794417.1 ABC-2 type transport system ATP-binding protein [Microlunatus kandeliicorticis]